jgi:hypothetical protein
MGVIVCRRRGRGKAPDQKALTPISPQVGHEYIISKYWTGTFRARVVAISEMGTMMRVEVTDAMRPGPLIDEKCPYPECVAVEGHDGDHEFSQDLRNGIELDLRIGHVQLSALEPEKANVA